MSGAEDAELDAALTDEVLAALEAGDPEPTVRGVRALDALLRVVRYLRERVARFAGVVLGDRVRIEAGERELRGRVVGVCLQHWRDAKPGAPLEYIARVDVDGGDLVDVELARVVPEPGPPALVRAADDDESAARARERMARLLGAELGLRHGMFLLVFDRQGGFRSWSIKGTRDEAAEAVLGVLYHLHQQAPLPPIDRMEQALAQRGAVDSSMSTGIIMDTVMRQLGVSELRLSMEHKRMASGHNLTITEDPVSGETIVRKIR